MGLHVKADGILETHVTWEDVEKHLQKTLDTKATFGPNKTAVNISDMKGFMSRIALVEADWQGVEDGKELPDKFIVKISSQLAFFNLTKIMVFDSDEVFLEKVKKLGTITRECHNREVDAYKLLMKFNHPDIPYTKVYALKSFDDENDLKGYIIAAHVPNVHSVMMYESIPADELVSLSRGIGTFAGLGEKLSADEKKFAGGPEYLEMMFKDVFDKENLEKMFNNLRKAMGESHPEEVEKLIDIYWLYFRLVKKYTSISELLGFKGVLNHGDLWQANMLHSKDEDGKLKLEAMIDWQGVSIMPPGLDNARLLMGCLNTEDHRTRGMELLKVYHDAFHASHDHELFSFQELVDSYHLYFPMMAMIIQPGMMSMVEALEIPEPARSEVKKAVMEKMVGLMEDIFDVHEKNVEKFPDFMSDKE